MSDARPDSIRCVPRTTLDIDATVLRELKRRQKRERKSLGRLVSELLAPALASDPDEPQPFHWTTRRMGTGIDLEDKEAVWAVLDER